MLEAERRLYASPRLRAGDLQFAHGADEIHERFGLPRERLPIIYNAIDATAFNPGLSVHRANVRARYGIADDACVFLLVGSAYARKGVGRVLEALAAVPAPAHFIVVGRDRRSAKYAALARRFGVAHRVTFAGPQKDPRPFYGAADAFVLPTLYDPFPNAVLEAMASGLPVVTSDRCGAAELVARARRGYGVRRPRHRRHRRGHAHAARARRARTRRRQRRRGRAAAHAGRHGGAPDHAVREPARRTA